MSDSTTWEEASRCPRCKQTGSEIALNRGPEHSSVHTLQCENKRCIWYNTTWIVQRLADGTVPIRTEAESRVREYPKLPPWAKQQADAAMESITRDETIDDHPS